MLHVDDDREFSERLASRLATCEPPIHHLQARTGPDGLSALEGTAVDCVVTEFALSGTDGRELLEAIRERAPTVPVIVCTDSGSEAIAGEAIASDGSGYVPKGDDGLSRLVERIDAALEDGANQPAIAEPHEALVETMDVLAFHTDTDGRFVVANEAFRDAFDVGEAALSGSTAAALFPPAVATAWTRDDDRILVDGESVTVDVPVPADETRTLRLQKTPVTDEAGNIVGIWGFATEITDCTQQIRELEQHVQLLEQTGDLVVAFDDAMNVVFESHPSERFEWEAHDLFEENPLEFLHPEDQPVARSAFERLLETPNAAETVELRTKLPDGEWDWMEARCQNITALEVPGTIMVNARDVTERKRQEERLARETETLETLQTITQQLLQATEPEEAAEIVVESIEPVFAFETVGIWLAAEDRESLQPVASCCPDPSVVPENPTYEPGTASLSWQAYEAQEWRYIEDMTQQEQRYNPETAIRSELIVPLDEYGILNIASTSIDAFSERDVQLVNLWADTVTEALARIDNQQRLREREREVRRERDRLEEFAGFLSHDLRNPLGIATGFVNLAKKDFQPYHLEKIENALERIESLMDDLLTLARQGDAIGDTEPVDLADLAAAAAETVAINPTQLEITVDRQIYADPCRLRNLFENCFRNSLEHAGEDVTVRIHSIEGGFAISDDGPGIPDDAQSTVFQGGYSTTESGMGLGLTIVSQIVQAHGWEIEPTTSEDGGASFEITGVTPA